VSERNRAKNSPGTARTAILAMDQDVGIMAMLGIVLTFLGLLFLGLVFLGYVTYRIMSWILLEIGKRALKEIKEDEKHV